MNPVDSWGDRMSAFVKGFLVLLIYLNIGLVFSAAVHERLDDESHFAAYLLLWPMVGTALIAAFDVLLVCEVVQHIRDALDEQHVKREE